MDVSESAVMAKHIVLDGLPANVTEAAKEKFQKFLSSKIKAVCHCDFTLTLSQNAEGRVDVAFVEFPTSTTATRAVEQLNGYTLTAKDTLSAYKWEIFEQMSKVPETYVEPEIAAESVAADMTNNMMLDPDARPQFIVKIKTANDPLQVQWNWLDWRTNKVQLYRKPAARMHDDIASWTAFDRDLLEGRKAHRESPIARIQMDLPMWSPYGSFLMTRHLDGIKLWAGSKMNLILHVNEPDVINVQISPNERFLVVKTQRDLSMWSVQHAKKLRSLRGVIADENAWPVMKFNADDSLCSVVRDGTLCVYDANTMRLVKQDEDARYTLKIDGIENADWSPEIPTQIALVIYDAIGYRVEIGNCTVHFEDDASGYPVATYFDYQSILRRNFLVAERVELPQYDVSLDQMRKEDAKLEAPIRAEAMARYRDSRFDILWHPTGKYFAAKFFNSKTKAAEYSLFKVGKSMVSAQQLTLKGTPVRFVWQPVGNLVAIIVEVANANTVTSGPRFQKSLKLCIYDLDGKNGITLLGEVETKGVRIIWAPKGDRLLSTKFETSITQLFVINAKAKTNKVEQLNNLSHNAVNYATWDPTGRFIVTCTLNSGPNAMQEGNRFILWDLHGNQLVEQRYETLGLFAFRPVSRTLLTEADLNQVRNGLSKYIQVDIERQAKVENDKAEDALKKIRDNEQKYMTRMADIEKEHTRRGWTEERLQLIESSPSYQRMLATLEQMEAAAAAQADEEADQ